MTLPYTSSSLMGHGPWALQSNFFLSRVTSMDQLTGSDKGIGNVYPTDTLQHIRLASVQLPLFTGRCITLDL
jgi:hypothetical protein